MFLARPDTVIRDPQALATLDYRHSHFRDGTEYDAELDGNPLDAYMSRCEADVLARLVPRLFPSGVDRYLDFACGTGRITSQMEAIARQSFAIDVSPGMMAVARRRCARTDFIRCDITLEQPVIEPVQLITAFRFFGNAQQELRVAALRGLHRLLADDGYLIFNNHRNPRSIRNLCVRLTDEGLPDYRGRHIDLDYWTLRRLIAATGFRIVRTIGVGFWIVRAALERSEILRSPVARALEPLSRLPLLAPFCPDAIVVARRV
jgi:SAM-dependent methyltransferase